MKIVTTSKAVQEVKRQAFKSDFEIFSNIPFTINKCPQTNLRVITLKYIGHSATPTKIKNTKQLLKDIELLRDKLSEMYL